jgi:arsenate reductase
MEMDTMPKIKVLFLCTGNSARSILAEAILRHQAGARFDVFSAGIEPKGVNPYSLAVLSEEGISTAGLESKSLDRYAGKEAFDYVITLCADAEERCPMFPGRGVRLHWPFEDPAASQGTPELVLEKFRQVRDEIGLRIAAWVGELGK